MGKQYNKIEKRKRRERHLKRKNKQAKSKKKSGWAIFQELNLHIRPTTRWSDFFADIEIFCSGKMELVHTAGNSLNLPVNKCFLESEI